MTLWARLFGRGVKSALGSDGTSSLDLRRGEESDPITWTKALQVSTVLRCVSVIANGVSQVPFRLYQDDGGKRRAAKDHPLSMLISRRPSRWVSSYQWRETMMFHALLTGNAYAFVNRVGIGRQVKEIVQLVPSCVSLRRLADGEVEYSVTSETGGTQVFAAEAIWHLRGPSWDTKLGLDALKNAREAIGLAVDLEKGQREFQKNGAQVSGVLATKTRISPEKYAFLSGWLDQHMPGGERAGRPILLDDEGKFTSMRMSGVDAEVSVTRKIQIEEICRHFGVMPIMVGHADKTATYASAEQMFLAHVVHTLAPWYQRIEQSADINLLTEEELLAGYYTKFTPNALMRGAAKDRADFYAKALGAGGGKGWMTQNDVRDLEEMDRIDDPDADKLPQPAAAGAAPTQPATTVPPKSADDDED